MAPLADARNVTEPVPVPEPVIGEVIVSHGVEVVAVHAHPEAVVMLMVGPGPASPIIDTFNGDTVYAQGADCETVTVRPATVRVPFLAAVPAATLNVTEPEPLPLMPAVMVIHGTLLRAAQGQFIPVVTVTTCPTAPAAATVKPSGFTVVVQSGGAAACVTVTARPATVSVPFRAAPVFAAMRYSTVPFPEPVSPEVMVIHELPLLAVQLQNDVVDTVIEPVLVAAPVSMVVGFTTNEHGAAA
jgi:hypothetical protein